MTTLTCRALVVSGFAGAVLLCCRAGHAQVADQTGFRWITPNGGTYQQSSNWDPTGVPSRDDTALFDLTEAYTVDFGDGVVVNATWLLYGTVTYNLRGHSLEMRSTSATTPGLMVGQGRDADAELVIANGIVRSVNAGIADNGNTQINRPRGRLALSGAASRLEVAGEFGVGHTGPGTLDVFAGAQVESNITAIGWIEGAHGSASVTGTGSSLVTRDVFVGLDGVGRLLVDQGASIRTTRQVSLGENATADGVAVVRGPTSIWEHVREPANSRFVVGDRGSGMIGVLEGGTIVSDEPVDIRARGTLFGDGLISADVLSQGLVSPGGDYDSMLQLVTLSGAGLLEVDGAFVQSPNGQLSVEMGGLGLGSQFDSLNIVGIAVLAGDLRVTLIGGFTPSAGQRFEILSAGAVVGQFTSTMLPQLGSGLAWQVDYGQNAVILAVVPSPTTIIVLIAGGLAVPCVRRRRFRNGAIGSSFVLPEDERK